MVKQSAARHLCQANRQDECNYSGQRAGHRHLRNKNLKVNGRECSGADNRSEVSESSIGVGCRNKSGERGDQGILSREGLCLAQFR
jgi:hypothetical protein